jgi:hypothetical protein
MRLSETNGMNQEQSELDYPYKTRLQFLMRHSSLA